MGDEDFARRASGVGALADPVRRALYRYVTGADAPVGRDQAAAAVDVPRHVARFHLDRLVTEGLLQVEYRRLTGRTGPGAGRPAKLYRRAPEEVAVSLPERRYDLAGALMAEAIESASRTGAPVARALDEAAARRGRALGDAAARPGDAAVPPSDPAAPPSDAARAGSGRAPAAPALDALRAALEQEGYEPRVVGHDVVLANCPFHALVREHTELVCGMNLALLGALGERLGGVRARLDPAPGRCCVVLSVGAEG